MANVKNLFIASLLILAVKVQAEVKLPSLFGNNMVLQRNKPLNIWGWANNGEKVTIYFLGKNYKTSANANGKWKIVLASEQAGGPYDMTIKASNTITLTNILIGDVFVCSGQSNMELKVSGADSANEVIANAVGLKIRSFKVPNTIANLPKEDVRTTWIECNPSSVGKISAVAYFFARELYHKTKVPVGIIESYWGGTAIETWLSPEALVNDPEFGAHASQMKYKNIDSMVKKNSEDYNTWLNETVKKDPGYDNGTYSWAKQWHQDWQQLTIPGRFMTTIKDQKMKDGIVWLSTTVDLTDNDVKDTCFLGLGRIVDDNLAFVNGAQVGFTNDGKYVTSKYPVAPNLLHTGTNIITVRVINYGNKFHPIGVSGNADLFYFKTKLNIYTLAKAWNYKVSLNTVFSCFA